ncbi:hypothetical protein TWF694_003824 [Orbilia ellipsospora]|uniref:Uncharacterized protein n=1 Tax=Orbilia ellipsospora TaxID=2528407 RepID=A0AAV9WZE0_9PEZI
MPYLSPAFTLLYLILLSALFPSLSNIQCYALSERFYKDYIDAQSLLRGGGIRASNFQERQLVPGTVQCTPGTNTENLQELLLCEIKYSAAEASESPTTKESSLVEAIPTSPLLITTSTPSTKRSGGTSQATGPHHPNPSPTKQAQDYQIFSNSPKPLITAPLSSTLIKRSLQRSYIFSRDLVAPHPHPYQAQVNSSPGWFDENLACDILFAGSVYAAMATASATVSMFYDPYIGVIFIGTTKSGSIDQWSTSSTLELASTSPFPDGLAHIQNWVAGGYPAIVNEFASICADIDAFEALTSSQRYPSDIWPTTTAKPDMGMNGFFRGQVRYSTVRATWTANWGPYDLQNRKLPFTVSFTGADCNHSYSITEAWTAKDPITQTDAMNMIITMAAYGPSTIASFLSQWNYAQQWPAGILDRRGPKVESNSFAPVTESPIHSLLITEKQSTTVVAFTTKTVRITSTQTNTLIPLFGRAANSPTSAEKNPKASKFPTSLILWIFILALLLTICTIALGWRAVSDYYEKQRQKVKSSSEGSPNSNPSLSKFNIFSNLCRTRHVSGNQVVNPHLLNNMRNRSKASFESIKLDD